MIKKQITDDTLTVLSTPVATAQVKKALSADQTGDAALYVVDLYDADGKKLAENRDFPQDNPPFDALTDVETDVLQRQVADNIDSYYVADLDELYAILDTPDEVLIEGYHDMVKAEKLTALKEYLGISDESV